MLCPPRMLVNTLTTLLTHYPVFTFSTC